MTEPTPPVDPTANGAGATPPSQPQAPQPPQAPPFAQAPQSPQPPQFTQGGPAGPSAPQPQAKTNTLAIISLVGAFFVSLVGIICGHIALKQIKRTGEKGRGLALAGTILGYVFFAATLLTIILTFVFAAAALNTANASLEEYNQQQEQLEADPSDDDAVTEESTSGSGDDLCAILDEVMSVSSVNSDGSVPDEYLNVFKRLSEADSPNQATYQEFYALISDPASAATTDFSQLYTDVTEALSSDYMACM